MFELFSMRNFTISFLLLDHFLVIVQLFMINHQTMMIIFILEFWHKSV